MKKYVFAFLYFFSLSASYAESTPPAPPFFKESPYQTYVDAFHLNDFLGNGSDISSVIKFAFVFTPTNKDMKPQDIDLTYDDNGQPIKVKIDKYWDTDLPIRADLYQRNPMVKRVSQLPGTFNLGLDMFIVGQFDKSVARDQITKAVDHYDDLISRASFLVRNLAPSMSVVVVRSDDMSGRCYIDGVEDQSSAKAFDKNGEIKLELKKIRSPAAKQVLCTTKIAALLLSDE
jgi:hypothetical protein